ncbi:MAG: DUF4149 domain-containing protein [Phycisphaerales bacterium]
MTPLRRWLEVAHITTAGLWTGAVAMTGAAAAVIFPTVKAIDPTLPAYTEYAGEHWRLAAGLVAARIFAIGDIVQFIAALVTGVSLAIIALSRSAWATRVTTFFRLVAFGIALLLLAYNLFVLGPRMNGHLTDYWTAARAGQNEQAERARNAFMDDHGPATNTLAGTVLATLVLTAVGVASVSRAARSDVAGPPREGAPEPPALLRRKSS